MSKANVKEIAEWIFETSAKETSTQNWITYYNDICKKFGVTKEWCRRKHKEILNCLNEDDRILEVQDDEECFDIIVAGDEVCKRCDGSFCESCSIAD